MFIYICVYIGTFQASKIEHCDRFLHWYAYLLSHRPGYTLSNSLHSMLLYSPVCSLSDALHTCHYWLNICPFCKNVLSMKVSKTMTILFTVISSAPNKLNSV